MIDEGFKYTLNEL